MSEYIEITLNDGSVMGSHYYEGLVIGLSELDWAMPTTALDFKNNTRRRAMIAGITLHFNDAKSFIQACSKANIIQSVVVYQTTKHADFVQ